MKKSGTASAAFAGFSTTGAAAGTTTGAAAGAAAGRSSGPDWSHFTAVGYLTISRRYSRRLRRLIVLV